MRKPRRSSTAPSPSFVRWPPPAASTRGAKAGLAGSSSSAPRATHRPHHHDRHGLPCPRNIDEQARPASSAVWKNPPALAPLGLLCLRTPLVHPPDDSPKIATARLTQPLTGPALA